MNNWKGVVDSKATDIEKDIRRMEKFEWIFIILSPVFALLFFIGFIYLFISIVEK
jgi:hypothetical protein